DRPPGLVAEVEVKPAVQSTDADVDLALRRIKVRLGFNHVERRCQRLGTRRSLRRVVETTSQPTAEALGADRPGLAMAIDIEIGKTGVVRGMEQLGRLRQPNQDVGLLRAASARVAALFSYRFVERRPPAAGTL